jgi:branched-chain amino acid aminotransferase
MHMAEAMGVPCEERTLARSDLVIADELFYTGTAAEIVPIREIDDHPIGEPGPLTQEIQRVFHEVTAGRSSAFARYLEYVDEAVKA